ncbi:MAG: hypothetical protein SCARUB_03586 [Candidatus Scalindua rubra]|uniref:Uncharacterized protein n=1 Tax=Candidatus Scalindua rubra TaxID=1872076 RepID=A0A1E3X6K9_9BACT|nr:MAG: hypothetical protein SCARUB_03586 [Candidatus Scalindua rubra]
MMDVKGILKQWEVELEGYITGRYSLNEMQEYDEEDLYIMHMKTLVKTFPE